MEGEKRLATKLMLACAALIAALSVYLVLSPYAHGMLPVFFRISQLTGYEVPVVIVYMVLIIGFMFSGILHLMGTKSWVTAKEMERMKREDGVLGIYQQTADFEPITLNRPDAPKYQDLVGLVLIIGVLSLIMYVQTGALTFDDLIVFVFLAVIMGGWYWVTILSTVSNIEVVPGKIRVRRAHEAFYKPQPGPLTVRVEKRTVSRGRYRFAWYYAVSFIGSDQKRYTILIDTLTHPGLPKLRDWLSKSFTKSELKPVRWFGRS